MCRNTIIKLIYHRHRLLDLDLFMLLSTTLERCRVSGGIAPTFITSALAGGEWAASHLLRFTPGEKSPRYPLVGRLGGPQSRLERCGIEINILALSGIEPQSLGLSALSQSGIPILKWISKNITCVLDSAGIG
jgi:hypothetical protein